jgi:outer membrane protein OmpA-like peptidoglycan-associated protein
MAEIDFEPEEHSPWPAFADLLAATSLLFLILFAATTVPAIGRNRARESTLARIDSALTRTGQRHRVKVSRPGDYLLLRIEGDATFPQRRSELADLRPEGRQILREFGEYVRSDSGLIGAIDQIEVVGHTSREGADSTNWRLSSSRAASVALFLIDSVHIPPCQVTALGRSRYYPSDPERARASAEPNPADRRIELEIRPRIPGDVEQQRQRGRCVAGSP